MARGELLDRWRDFFVAGRSAPCRMAHYPEFTEMISQADFSTLGFTYLFGVLWGIGGLTYGLGVRYLGVSLGSSIILGLCMVFGSLVPAIYYDFSPTAGKDTFSMMAGALWGKIVLAGLLVCVLGIILCGLAGTRKEKELKVSGTDPHGGNNAVEYKFGLGLLVSIVSGLLSACFNFGLEAGQGLSQFANDVWKSANPGEGEFLFRNNVVYVVLLWGGLTTNFVWCMILNVKNKSSSFSMVWVKAGWVMAPAPGYCICRSLF